MAEIAIADLAKRYGGVWALEGVSIDIPLGTVHGLIGPNGSGKTTLLRLLAGLERPTTGTIDRPTGPVGVSFQHPRFYPALTADENIAVFADLADEPPGADWIDELCDAIRLTPVRHRRAADLSGGFAKKLDLALAVLKRPPILLLDEPVGDVDDYSRTDIRAFLDAYRAEDRAIVLSTHDVEGFTPILDRVTKLVNGRVVDEGPPDEVDRPSAPR